jgi:hypothetical protein
MARRYPVLRTQSKGVEVKRLALLVSALLAVALPVGALANPGTNGTTSDSWGWCVSHGAYWDQLHGTTVGGERSVMAQSAPGAVAAMKHANESESSICVQWQDDPAWPWVAPGQAGK